jgi:hypothetical protein
LQEAVLVARRNSRKYVGTLETQPNTGQEINNAILTE